jgi:methylaspartate mutase sigma subunit
MEKHTLKIVTGVIGNDVHAVANRLIELELEERGYTVFNLGVNTMIEEFIDAIVETNSSVLLISSLNGEAESWTNTLHTFKEKNHLLSKVLFVIGGNLSIGESRSDINKQFKKYGFDMVFHQQNLAESIDKIEKKLGLSNG